MSGEKDTDKSMDRGGRLRLCVCMSLEEIVGQIDGLGLKRKEYKKLSKTAAMNHNIGQNYGHKNKEYQTKSAETTGDICG